MPLISREQFRAIKFALITKEYKAWTTFIRRHLFLARLPILQRNRVWTKVLQNAFAIKLSKIEEAIQKGKAEVNRLKKEVENEKSEDKKKELSKRIVRTIDQKEVNERIRLAIKSITDGIAWRNMRFDRNIIRVLSEGDSTGHVEVDKPGGQAEDQVSYRIIKELKSVVIRNDLTNFIRIGDLTEISYPDIFLHEVKASVKKDGRWRLKSVHNMFSIKKDQKLTKQTAKLLQAQSIILERKIMTPEGEVKFVDIDIPFKTYFPIVRKLIREARKMGHSCRKIDDYLVIECESQDVLIDRSLKEKRKVWLDRKQCENWSKKDIKIVSSNYDSFIHEDGQFLRNVAPYTVFPFPIQDCTDLLTGNLFLQTKINVSLLMQKFEEAGWQVEPKDFKKSPAPLHRKPKEVFGGDIFSHIETEAETLFYISRPPFSLSIPFNFVSRIAYEFMTVDTLLNFCEYIHKNSVPYEPKIFSAMFKEERKFWK